MERCDQEYALVNNKSYYTPNGDPEWVYMYSRLEFLHKLVLAFTFSMNGLLNNQIRKDGGHIIPTCTMYKF